MGNCCAGCCVGNCCRTLVSKKKKRIHIEPHGTDELTGLRSAGGVDLDLTLVHKRVVAMGFPSVGLESCWRNPRNEAVDLLDENFGTAYRVYNLCSESNRQYEPAVFGGRVYTDVQWPDHFPPTVEMLRKLLADVQKWLAASPSNIAVVHCLAGKGRTGVVVCCIMLILNNLPSAAAASVQEPQEAAPVVDTAAAGEAAAEPAAVAAATKASPDTPMTRRCTTADEAIEFWGAVRTHDNKGLTVPSQRRYVRYFAESINRVPLTVAELGSTKRRLKLTAILVNESLSTFTHVHIVMRNPIDGDTTARRVTIPLLGGDFEGAWLTAKANDVAAGAADGTQREDGLASLPVQDDFVLCFAATADYPCKGAMLWLNAEHVAVAAANDFPASEIDGWKAYWKDEPAKQVVSLQFALLEEPKQQQEQ